MDHVWKLQKGTVFVFIGMITWLRGISSTACYEYSSIFGLDWAESDRNIEIDIQKFSCLFIGLNIIKGQDSLIKFKEMDSVCGALVTESLKLVRVPQLIKSAHSDSSSQEWILCIRTSKSHALSKHLLSTTIRTQDAVWMLSELRVDYGRILASILQLFLLLKQYMLKFHIAIIEYKSLSHELFQKTSINWLEFKVLLETFH